MKPLNPSIRENKRYLLVKGKNLKKNIEKSILDFIGILGMSKVSLKYIKSWRDSAIICINRDMVHPVRASFCLSLEKVKIEKISGTIKGLNLKI